MVWAPILGALASGAVGWGLNKLSGGSKQEKPRKLPTMNPQQEALLTDFISRTQGLGEGAGKAGQYFQNFLDPNSEQFRNFEAPYLRQHREQGLPQLAERFAGSGGGLGAQGGALSSSGFAQALGAADAGLQEKLAQMKSGLQYGAASDLLRNYQGMAGIGLGKDSFAYQDRGASSGTSFLSGLSQNLTPGVFTNAFEQISGIGGSTGNRYGYPQNRY